MALYHFAMKQDRKPNGDKIMADEHADYNEREGKYQHLDDADEAPTVLNSADHADYINRDATFASKGGCAYKAHRLPNWANESPKAFFSAAAAYEESEHTYKELEFALQNELTLKQNIEIIEAFISQNFSDYYYAYAVHNKEATLGNGEKNPHCHFMFSMRQMDELEKEQERAPECFFKKARRVYTKKDGSITDNRRMGGCKVPDCWNKFYVSSDHLRYLRADFAQITNRVLEEYHIPARVDHRSNKERYEEALKENDEFRAQLYALPPEEHLGPDVANQPNDPRVVALKEQRKLRHETIRMIEGITRLEHLAADYRLVEKQKNLADGAAEIAESTHEISVDEEMLSDADVAELSRNSINAAQDTDEKQAAVLSFSDAIQRARHAEMTPQELAEELALRQIYQEKAELQKEYDDLEAHVKSLRSLKITAALKELPDYNVLAAIENADAEHKDEDAAPLSNSISLEIIQSELAADAEYAELQAKKSETAAKLQDCAQKAAAQTERLKEISLRLNASETKQQTQAEALRLFAENQKERDEYQEASLQEISLLKQKIQMTGTKIAVLQEDVILYRQAIEEAKESYLKELRANAEETLPEIEEKIATVKQRIAEKEKATQEAFASREISEKGALPMPKVEAKKVMLTLPSGYDKAQYRMWVTKVEIENKKHYYEIKTSGGAWIGNYSGRKAENPGQFYVHRPEENATYTVWCKDLATGKSEMTVKTKFTDGAMNPLPLPDEARLLYLEKQKQDLLQKKEFLSIFQQNKLVSQETFELKKELQTLDRQIKTSTFQASPSLEHRRRALEDKLEKMQEDKKQIREKMREIRKLFGTKEVKSTLTSMANDLTLGDVPQKKTIEALQADMTADVERVRAILATRIRVMNEQTIADRLADAHRTDALERHRHRTERRYTALEVRKTIYDVLAAIRAEKQTLAKELAPLEERYFSEARARKMAIDVYTENKTKELRQLNRAIEKKSEQLRKSDDKLLAKEYALLNMKKPRWYEQILGNAVNEQYNAMQQEAAQLKQQANANKAALYSLQVKAAKTETELNGILKVPEAAAKIEAITQGILKKNQFVTDQVFTLRARKTRLLRQETEFTKFASAATRQIEADRGKNVTYAARGKGNDPSNKIEIAALITKAFDGSNAACAAVARINTDDQSILDWEGKNAAERKAAQRESTWDRNEF